MEKNIRRLVAAAVIGALYATLTISLSPLSYGNIQFRLSEALCLLPFAYKPAVWGLFVGCILANLASPAGALDVVFGSLATLLAAYMTSRLKNRLLAPLPMAIVNGLVIGAILAYTGSESAFWPAFAVFSVEIAASELAVGYLAGLPLLALFEKIKPRFDLGD